MTPHEASQRVDSLSDCRSPDHVVERHRNNEHPVAVHRAKKSVLKAEELQWRDFLRVGCERLGDALEVSSVLVRQCFTGRLQKEVRVYLGPF